MSETELAGGRRAAHPVLRPPYLLLLPGYFCCGLLVILDALFPLWDPKKQTRHDKIGKSVVIKSA